MDQESYAGADLRVMLRIGRVLVNFHSLCAEGYAALHQLVDIAFCGWAFNSECCRRGTDMTSISRLISRYPLIAFFAIAYSAAWRTRVVSRRSRPTAARRTRRI
jgi:hypothetical protein